MQEGLVTVFQAWMWSRLVEVLEDRDIYPQSWTPAPGGGDEAGCDVLRWRSPAPAFFITVHNPTDGGRDSFYLQSPVPSLPL